MSELPFQGRLNYSTGEGLSSFDSSVLKNFESPRGNITPSVDYSFQRFYEYYEFQRYYLNL